MEMAVEVRGSEDGAGGGRTGADRPPTDKRESFEAIVLPHLDAAYRLARWMMHNDHDAEDVVQEAALRALRYFQTFTGGNGRAWFLKIVRNTCHGWYGSRVPLAEPFDEAQHSHRPAADPETLLLVHIDDVALIQRGMRQLPRRFRELLVLRELEGLSYQELADVLGVPVGTVMSGLSRARQAFRRAIEHDITQSHAGTAPSRERELKAALV
jgi:RNA polymerase sigma-70 factor (ECF subfamily)